MTLRLTNRERASSAATLLVLSFALNLALTLSSYLVRWRAPEFFRSEWMLLDELAWLALSVPLVIGLFKLASVVEERLLAMLSAAGWVVMVLTDLASTLLFRAQLNSGGDALVPRVVELLISDATTLISIAARAVLFIFLARVTMKSHAWVMPALAFAFLFLLARTGIALAASHTLVGTELVRSDVYRYGSVAVGVYGAVAVLLSAWALRQTVKATQAGLPPPNLPERQGPAVAEVVPVSPALDFVVGGLFLAVGAGVTAVSFSASASTGGRYVVATGAIAVGVVRIVRGLIRLGKR